MAEHGSKKSEPFVHLPDIKKLEEEIKSEFYELRHGKIWFSEEIKREHRRLKTSLIRYLLQSRIFRDSDRAIYICLNHSVFAPRRLCLDLPGRLFSCLWHTKSAAPRLHGD